MFGKARCLVEGTLFEWSPYLLSLKSCVWNPTFQRRASLGDDVNYSIQIRTFVRLLFVLSTDESSTSNTRTRPCDPGSPFTFRCAADLQVFSIRAGIIRLTRRASCWTCQQKALLAEREGDERILRRRCKRAHTCFPICYWLRVAAEGRSTLKARGPRHYKLRVIAELEHKSPASRRIYNPCSERGHGYSSLEVIIVPIIT